MENLEKKAFKQPEKDSPTEQEVNKIIKAAYKLNKKSPGAKDLGAAAAKEDEINPKWLHHIETEGNRLRGKIQVAERNVKAAETELEEAKKRLEFFKKELAATKKLLAELGAIQKAKKLSKDKKERKKDVKEGEQPLDKEQLAA